MNRDFATVLLIVSLAVVLIIVLGEHKVPEGPVIHASLLTARQIPLVAPCITPAPQPAPRKQEA